MSLIHRVGRSVSAYGSSPLGPYSALAAKEISDTLSKPKNWTGKPNPKKRKRDKEEDMGNQTKEAAVANEDGNYNVGPVVRKFRRGAAKQVGKAKAPKPSSAFRTMVHKSLTNQESHGHKTDFEYFYMPDISINKQCIGVKDMASAFSFGNTVNGTSYLDVPMFHSQYFLDAASVLFNNKSSSQGGGGSFDLTTTGTFGYGASPGMGTVALNAQTAKFTVVNSMESWLIKNNTTRVITLKIVLCAPKVNGTSYNGPYDVDTGTYVAAGAPDFLGGPTYQWAKSQLGDRDNGLTQNFPESLRTLPTSVTSWTKQWKHEITEVVLEPGSSYDYHVQGPKDLLVDFTKYLQGTKVYELRKYTRFPVFIWHADIVGNSGLVGGQRFAWSNPSTSADYNAGQGVFLERKKYVKIQCPTNMAGPIVSTTNPSNPQQIALNRSRYFTYQWNPSTVGLLRNKTVEKQNPQTIADG